MPCAQEGSTTMQIIQDTIAGLELGAPVVHRQMAMFPLLDRKPDPASRTYVTLDEALESATAQVSEVSNGGSVPELLFKNLGEQPVLLVEGEEVVGAKQNRTLNISILAPPRQETPIPVSCVERGRWGYGDDVVFEPSDRAHYARGRRAKTEAVNRNIRRDAVSRHADQGAVWEDIDAKMAAMSARSETDAMGDIYEQHRESLDDYVGAFEQQPGQVGAVFLVGATFAGLDLFAHETTFAGLLPKPVPQLRARRAGSWMPRRRSSLPQRWRSGWSPTWSRRRRGRIQRSARVRMCAWRAQRSPAGRW